MCPDWSSGVRFCRSLAHVGNQIRCYFLSLAVTEGIFSTISRICRPSRIAERELLGRSDDRRLQHGVSQAGTLSFQPGGLTMLVLTRKAGQRLMVGEDIVVTVLSVRNGQVRIGIEAPRSVSIRREELDVL